MSTRRQIALAACSLAPVFHGCKSSPTTPDDAPSSSTLIIRLDSALIAVADVGGSPDTLVIASGGDIEGEHEVSPDGAYVTYFFDPTGGAGIELHIARTDGTSDVTLTGFDGSVTTLPSWSPDSQRLVFATRLPPRILTVDPDGTGLDTIVDTPQYFSANPHWSPSGDLITFGGYVVGEEATTSGIWTVRPNGSDAHLVTSAEVYTLSPPARSYPVPRFSPDGAWIAFDDEGDLHVVRADGTQRRALTSSPLEDEWYPRWSPDGARLAIIADGGTRWAIQILNVSNGSVVGGVPPHTAFDMDAIYPAWSPDGQRIAFMLSRLSAGTYQQPASASYAVVEGGAQTDWSGASAPDLSDGLFPEWWPDR